MTHSRGNELECGESACGFGKSLHPFSRSFSRILFSVRGSDGIAGACAAHRFSADTQLNIANLNRARWFLFESLEPSVGLVVPRPHEHSIVYDDNPHAGVSMRCSA